MLAPVPQPGRTRAPDEALPSTPPTVLHVAVPAKRKYPTMTTSASPPHPKRAVFLKATSRIADQHADPQMVTRTTKTSKASRGSLNDVVMDKTSHLNDHSYSDDNPIASRSTEDVEDSFSQEGLADVHDQNITLLKNRKEGRVYCNRALSSGLLCSEECASVGGLEHHLSSSCQSSDSTDVDVSLLIQTIQIHRRSHRPIHTTLEGGCPQVPWRTIAYRICHDTTRRLLR